MRTRRSEKNREKERNDMPRIGDTHAILADIGAAIGPGHRELPRLLPGRIVYINRAHRWFLVEADLGDGVKVREGFKF